LPQRLHVFRQDVRAFEFRERGLRSVDRGSTAGDELAPAVVEVL
jgi:hypothetical protein